MGFALFVFFTLAAVPGCLPSKFTIDLAPQTGKLAESVVDKDGSGAFGRKVALIDVQGLISETAVGGLFASRTSAVDQFVAQLDKAASDSNVRAVVLRINSPGGTVAATETLYEEIKRFRDRTGKPVIASFAEVAASGGYYIALACDEIVAQRSSITGSVGVIIQTFNVSRGMSMIGIDGRAVTSRDNKDIANPFQTANEEHYEILQAMVDDFYATFRSRVLESREIAPEDIDTVTDGRVVTGTSALEYGLVDHLGGVRDAFARAKELAGVSNAKLIKYHSPGTTLRTPYARAQSTIGTDSQPSSPFAWLSEQLRPGAYYLWTAGSDR